MEDKTTKKTKIPKNPNEPDVIIAPNLKSVNNDFIDYRLPLTLRGGSLIRVDISLYQNLLKIEFQKNKKLKEELFYANRALEHWEKEKKEGLL